MRNAKLERLDFLVGTWDVTLSDAWFLEPAGTQVAGRATVQWLQDAFLVLELAFDGGSGYQVVIGHHDAHDAYVALYHDERGVSRKFDMTFDENMWTLDREDPDFYQRFVSTATPDRIAGRWEASEDEGRTWRKDYDLTFIRVGDRSAGTP